MTNDSDLKLFLKYSGAYMDINALRPNWERHFADTMVGLGDADRRRGFQRGFAKAVLGKLPPDEYEYATGWDFDSREQYLRHIRKYWTFFYPTQEPEDVLAGN